MNSIFESQRLAHEANDRLENLAASVMLVTPKTHREKLANAHQVANLLNMMVQNSQKLSEQYEDRENLRQVEAEWITNKSTDLTEFYARLKIIEEKYEYNTVKKIEPMEVGFMELNQGILENMETMFSGEEHYGRFLDLHEMHERYLNLREAKKLSYMDYLDSLSSFNGFKLPAKDNDFVRYLDDLIIYLESFISRAQPLEDLFEHREQSEKGFLEKWTRREIIYWAEVFKEEGNDEEYCVACRKQFDCTLVFQRHLNEKRHLRAQRKMQSISVEKARNQKRIEKEQKYKHVAAKEYYLRQLCLHLLSEIEATKENVERKQTLTETELQEEVEENEVPVFVDTDDEEDKIYNPLRLPLGWDGKPIPYWLYKLHGLGVEYSCEICGNYVYMGRKAFEKHFQEWRHTHGLKCLGISSFVKHYSEITKIDDALELNKKINESKKKEAFRPEIDEEFEDQEGNVYNRKTYEDLLRQGLL